MKRALFISRNLLGDGLNIAPALRAWGMDHYFPAESEHPGEWCADLLTNNDPIKEIYSRMGVDEYGGVMMSVINDELQRRPPYDFEFNFDVGKAFQIGQQKGLHITECYADMLGVKIHEYTPTFITTEEEHEKDLVLLSPFSKSCESNEGRPPNKMLPWPKVDRLLCYLRRCGKVGILGAVNDRAPIEASEDEYYTGLSLNKVALMLRDAKFLVTVDNGISHLAASQGTKSIVLYPACLDTRWIAPKGNPNAFVIHMNPVTLPLPSLIWQTGEILRQWKVI